MEENLKILKALSDETRLRIIKYLLDGEKCVCEIVPHVNRTQSTVSIHLKKLEGWDILESRKNGKNVFYRIKNRKVARVLNALK
ncbi:MAG: winged helix-turn-helix transcriptional regulator [Candidatus Aenigmarchaeota archaeon]|nr:winged helix-turn-helix transcriptional regulator [Candidatus Aenigmarchaeota archaeon]